MIPRLYLQEQLCCAIPCLCLLYGNIQAVHLSAFASSRPRDCYR